MPAVKVAAIVVGAAGEGSALLVADGQRHMLRIGQPFRAGHSGEHELVVTAITADGVVLESRTSGEVVSVR